MSSFAQTPPSPPASPEQSPLSGLHLRTLARQAVVSLLLADPACRAALAERIFANRFEAWLCPELPACGVYATREENLDANTSPDPDERRLSLEIELLAYADESLDDTLDALCLALEGALFRDHAIDALGEEMARIVEARLGQPLPRLENGRSVVDTLLLIKLNNTEIGIAVDGEREIGVAHLAFDLEYSWPKERGQLADFLLGVSGWDTEPADGKMEMYSLVSFDPEKKEGEEE